MLCFKKSFLWQLELHIDTRENRLINTSVVSIARKNPHNVCKHFFKFCLKIFKVSPKIKLFYRKLRLSYNNNANMFLGEWQYFFDKKGTSNKQ